MAVLKDFWGFLNTEVKVLPWGEFADRGIATVLATKDLGKTLSEQRSKLPVLEPYVKQVEPFLNCLELPVTQLALAGLPFLSVGVGLLRFYQAQRTTELSFEEAVSITAQLAYLNSLEMVLKGIGDKPLNDKLQWMSLKQLVDHRSMRLVSVDFRTEDAKKAIAEFRESVLAQQFGDALTKQLLRTGMAMGEVRRLVDRVAWGTQRYLHQAIAEAGDSVAVLAEVYRTDGQQELKWYQNLDRYLTEQIGELPNQQVFDEDNPLVRFRDMYVPLQVQPLTQAGETNREVRPICSHQWALGILGQWNVKRHGRRKVLFVEGEAGRGKSVFCRMFPNVVWQSFGDAWIPLVIRLRELRMVANNLTKTLADCPALEQWSFVQGKSDWLTDRSTRFLIILDGFDELLLEGRDTGGLKDFLRQVADFQERSHHQCLVTGRPLALQGVDQFISQTGGLERVRLEPMNDRLREQWFGKWAEIFGTEQAETFQTFLDVCPEAIRDGLARDPLLLYLLARLFREGWLSREMFTEIGQGKNRQVQAKLLVYRASVKWVLEKQRQNQNLRLAGLEVEELQEVLQEVALCVVQSGNETARVGMVKHRFRGSENPVAQLLREAQETTGQEEDKALNNLLTTFYIKPGEGDKQGSVEFAHKSFGEYLFAERLVCAFEEWTELGPRRRLRLGERIVDGQVYDLLGYGGLSQEIVAYVLELLTERSIDRVRLFERLEGVYWRWCDGEFLNQPPTDNLPQKKTLQLREQGVETGLKQVDIFVGLNLMILLFELHAESQPDSYPVLVEDAPKPPINFHPCGEPGSNVFRRGRLLRSIRYADSLTEDIFVQHVGPHLSRANLFRAKIFRTSLVQVDLSYSNLSRVDLSHSNIVRSDLSHANIYSASLFCADLAQVNLFCSNLSRADLHRASLANANLSRANLSRADLSRANLSNTNFSLANLYSANLSSSDLSSADLSRTNSSRADLSRANLSSANLSNANLYESNLAGANLSNANLSHANLSNVNLSNADLSSARLENALLWETDFRNAMHLSNEQLMRYEDLLICGALFPPTITIDPDRDWERLPITLHRRYPKNFKTIKAAEKFVKNRRQSKGI